MVRITNGENVYEVTRGAFDGIYSRQGYKIVDDMKAANIHPTVVAIPDGEGEDEKFIDELLEKPISQWNKTEVKRFAELKEIDITGTKNANEAKEIIKEFLEATE